MITRQDRSKRLFGSETSKTISVDRGRWSRVSGASIASALGSPLLDPSSWRDFEACSRLHELAPVSFCSSSSFAVDPTTDLLFSPVYVRIMIIRVKRRALYKPLRTTNDNVVIFRCTAYSKASLERNILLSKLRYLVCENRTSSNEGVIVWTDHQFTLFGHADAFNRRGGSAGNQVFLLVVAIGTRLLSNPLAAIDKRRKSILLVKAPGLSVLAFL